MIVGTTCLFNIISYFVWFVRHHYLYVFYIFLFWNILYRLLHDFEGVGIKSLDMWWFKVIVNIKLQKRQETYLALIAFTFFVFLILLLSTSHGQQILLHFLIWFFFAEAYSSNNYYLIWLKAKRALYVITLTPAASTVFVLRGNNVLLFFRSTDFYTDSRIKNKRTK